MITRIEEVETIGELVDYVRFFGLPTDVVSICMMQDVVGHTAVADFEAIATGDKQSTLTFILREIWGMDEFIAYYNKYCNKAFSDMKERAEKAESKASELEQKAYELEKKNSMLQESREYWKELANKYFGAVCGVKRIIDETLRVE